MAGRVFLHVGAPKTGTTYLQDTLAANRYQLAANGLSYPDTRSGSHFEAAIDLLDKRWGGALEQSRGEWDRLATTAARSTGDVVISHEVLAAATPEQVQRARSAFDDAEVHVVYTARDLGRQIPAEWQEMIKHRGRRRFVRFLDVVMQAPRTGGTGWFWRVQGLPDVLTRWGAGLAPERIHVVTVPPAGAEPDLLWQRFARTLGVDPGSAVERGARPNASMGTAETTFLRRLNVALSERDVPRPVYAELVRDLLARERLSQREDKVAVRLPPESRAFVEEVTQEWREWVEGAGVHVVGDLDDLDARWDDGPWVDPDRPGARLVANVAVDAVADLLVLEAERRKGDAEGPGRGLRRLFP